MIEGEYLTSVLEGTEFKDKPQTDDEKAGGGTAVKDPEPEKPVAPPKPGLAWESPSRIDPDVS